MAVLDLVLLIEGRWFGAEEPGTEPLLPQPISRCGSSGSPSDATGSEQADGLAGAQQQRRWGQSSRLRAPQPLQGLARYQNGLHDEDQNGVLGTWAGRQRVFAGYLRQQEQERQLDGAVTLQPPTGVLTEQRRGQPSPSWPRGETPPSVLAPAPVPAQPPMQPAETRLDQELNAAWRWRFTRKWHAEQMKQFQPQPPTGVNGGLHAGEDEEEWTEAMRLMDAVDGGLNMQIGRTLSLHNSSMVDGSHLSTELSLEQSLNLLSPGLSQCVLLEGSNKESPLREEAAAATSHIVSMARKAEHLRRKQQEIERQVCERWEAAGGGSHWIAQHLPAVQLDSWSTFPFVLVRLSEQRSQRQKLLVRGRNGATEQQTFSSTEQEVARAAIAHRLPGPRVELVAIGRMEWVELAVDQRRILRIQASRLLPPAAKDARLRSTSGVNAVVVQLSRASFPSGDFDIVAVETPPSSVRGSSGANAVPTGGRQSWKLKPPSAQ